ncbi:MAG: helix-turn-helix transcriptional regulator [Candidatus Sumerlaeia bacterium]|nr:helix-turn-helix transcriptional regulator [Candidatus Sumerlaeia bacterium]
MPETGDFFHIPGMVRFLYIGHLDCTPNWEMEDHSHPFHEIIHVARGRFHAVIGGRKVTALPGETLLYRANTTHSEWSDVDQPAETYYIGFEWSAAPPSMPLVSPDSRQRITTLARWLWDDRENRHPAHHILQLILREMTLNTPASEDSLLRDVREYFTANLREPVTLADVANHVGLSKHHFLRRFRLQSGRTPMDELRQLRLEHARHLILTTTLPLKAIPPLAGLHDQHQMTRLFRRHLGMTPGELRRKTS